MDRLRDDCRADSGYASRLCVSDAALVGAAPIARSRGFLPHPRSDAPARCPFEGSAHWLADDRDLLGGAHDAAPGERRRGGDHSSLFGGAAALDLRADAGDGAWRVAFGVALVLFGTVRANGKVVAPLVILFLAMYPVRLGFAYGFRPSISADALWWSFPAGMVAVMLMAVAYYRRGGWKVGGLSASWPRRGGRMSKRPPEPQPGVHGRGGGGGGGGGCRSRLLLDIEA